jgi:hypothetical protein
MLHWSSECVSASWRCAHRLFPQIKLTSVKLEREVKELKAIKKPRTSTQSTLFSSAPVAGPSTAKAVVTKPIDAKTVKSRKKALFDSLKRAAKSNDIKFQDVERTIKIEDHFTVEEFAAVFTGGNLIQPTPTNKPNSTVTIKDYSTAEQYADLFGEAWDPTKLKGFRWTRGKPALSL